MPKFCNPADFIMGLLNDQPKEEDNMIITDKSD